MATPENTYRRSVEKYLPDVYKLKLNLPWTAGVADSYYSGASGDLWVEWKYGKIPKRAAILPALSPLQKRWLEERHLEGRKVAVIIGFPGGKGIVYQDLAWLKPLTPGQVEEVALSREAIASFIKQHTGASPCIKSLEPSSAQRQR